MACGITAGIGIDCDSLRRVGGVNKRAWLFNIDDLDTYSTGLDGCITALNFDAYLGTYAFESRKQAHLGGYTPIIGGDGGNKFYQHDVQLKMYSDNCTDDQIVEELLVASVGIILETNNKEFKLYGAFNGMDQVGGQQSSGQVAASDISDTLIFQGEEQSLPKHILITDYATTKNYLETLVV